MPKMITQDELQYLEHCNKLIKETRESLQETEKLLKVQFDVFLPLLANYVNGMRGVQHDFLVVVRDILKSSKELQFTVSNYHELTVYTKAIEKLAETFKDPGVQAIIEIVKKSPDYERYVKNFPLDDPRD